MWCRPCTPPLAPGASEENRVDAGGTQAGHRPPVGPGLEIRAWKPRSKGNFKEPPFTLVCRADSPREL